MRRRLPEGVRMYTGDDFNYAELIAGDEQGYSRRAARHFRCDRAGRLGGAGARWPPATRRLPRHPGADRAAVAPHLQGADPLLQDRRRVPRLAQRPAGPFHHDRRPAERALARASGRAVPPGRRGAGAARSRLARAERMRKLLMASRGIEVKRDRMPVEDFPSISPPFASNGRCAKRWRPALRHGITRDSPWRDQVARSGSTKRCASSSANGLQRHRLVPRRHVPGRRRRRPRRAIDDNKRAIDEAAALGARLPGAGRRRLAAGSQRHRRAPATWCGRHRGDPAARTCRSMPLAIEPLHPMYAADRACVNTLGAGARHLRRARRGRRRRDRRLPRVVGSGA